MIWEEYSTASGPADVASIDLRTIWRVDADSTYNISVTRSKEASRAIRKNGGTGLIAIRTIDGKGEVCQSNKGCVEVEPGQLLLVEWEHLRSYRCIGERWHFWWFEFEAIGSLRAPLFKVLNVPMPEEELLLMNQTYFLLRNLLHERRCHASALFSSLLYGWLADWHGHYQVTGAQELVWQIVEKMHAKIADNWTVHEMADEVCLSERRLNQLFQQVVGVGPKRCYDRIRLNLAEELLQTGVYSVKGVAERLGFCNPYHFSRFFRSRTGYPPSETGKRIPS